MDRSVDPRVLAALRRYDTPTVLNVIELLDVRPRDEGFLDGSVRALFPDFPPIVGWAATATFRASRPAAGDSRAYAGFIDQVASFVEKLPEPRIVVFQDLDGVPVGATFGEVMCSVYQAFGCAGLITSGAARDVDQVRRLEFPCWAASVIASHAYCRIEEHDLPVDVAGCAIAPGDLIHADANGVALIPPGTAAAVAEGCRLLIDAEAILIDTVRSGAPSLDELREARRRSQEAAAAIRERVAHLL